MYVVRCNTTFGCIRFNRNERNERKDRTAGQFGWTLFNRMWEDIENLGFHVEKNVVVCYKNGMIVARFDSFVSGGDIVPFCTQCGAENPDTARFCDQCGAEMVALPASRSTPPLDAAAASPVVSAGPQSCPQCGVAVIPGEAFCDSCGAPLLSVGQPAAIGATIASVSVPSPNPNVHQPTYPPPQPVSAPPGVPPAQSPTPPTPVVPPAAGRVARVSLSSISFVVADTGDILRLPDASQAVVGRSDPVSKFFPDVDLASYGALQKGVGRRHMRLVVQNSQVCIEDLNSTNGTFLNSLRLVARMPQPVHDGDEVRLGSLVLRVQRS